MNKKKAMTPIIISTEPFNNDLELSFRITMDRYLYKYMESKFIKSVINALFYYLATYWLQIIRENLTKLPQSKSFSIKIGYAPEERCSLIHIII